MGRRHKRKKNIYLRKSTRMGLFGISLILLGLVIIEFSGRWFWNVNRMLSNPLAHFNSIELFNTLGYISAIVGMVMIIMAIWRRFS